MVRRFAVPVLAVATFGAPAWRVSVAQSANTSLHGVITDPSGAVVPGATITLLNQATGQTLTATANGSGEYQLQQIPPAKYTITVEESGFAPQTKTAELLVNQPATVSFKLSVSEQSTVVDVSTATETLNTTDATIGDAKDNALIQAIPTETRNVADLLSLQPGVFTFAVPSGQTANDVDSRYGAVNGERSDQTNVTVDGVDSNDQVRGLAFTAVLRETQDSVQEFRVTTTGANADSGRSAGAQVSMVTKSGTNKLHGAAYEYFRPSNTVSNDPFNKKAQLSSGEPNRPPKLIRNIFGADLGGPIIKDKLFFFGNYEGQRQAESTIVTQIAPTATFKQGIIQYMNNAQPNPGISQLTPAQIATLDAGCQVCNTTAYPNGPGPNPNILAYLNSMPTANGTAVGDGLNTGSYTFASPAPATLNTSIIRVDWTPSAAHHVFWRGNLQKDTNQYAEQFPGQGPSSILVDNTKGFVAGDTWTITPSLVNDIRYGYIRQGYSDSGIAQGDYVTLRYLSTRTAITRSTATNVPVNNIVDNLSWTKGHHTMQFGVNWRLIHDNRLSNANSFNSASTNPSFLAAHPPTPADLGAGFKESYYQAFSNLVGTVPQVTIVGNYLVSGATGGTLLAEGAPIARHFSANEYEGYVQDTWQATPKLTLVYGLRYTLLQTPWETNGQQVEPTIDTHSFYQQREAAAVKGQIYEPDLTFDTGGKFYNKPGFYPENKNNFAPRVAAAYAFDNKTTVRAGAGIYFDHFGEGVVNTFDQNGEFGLSGSITSPTAYTSNTAPRFTGEHNIPTQIVNGSFDPTVSFPYTYPEEFGIAWGIDNKIKTPYTEALDLSFQRELPGGFTLEADYVGRRGRHLLQQLDLTEPTDFVDPQGGGDYYAASAALAQQVDLHAGDQYATVAPIKYWEDMFPWMKGFNGAASATQAIYTEEYAPNRQGYGLTSAIADLEIYGANANGQPYPLPPNFKPRFWQNQFASLYSMSSVGMSWYDSLQLSLRHPMTHGFQADVHYTLSKSLDYGSDGERASEFSNGVTGANSNIINTWNPALNKAVSDFDTRHLVTLNTVYQLPFGHGRAFASGANKLVDTVIGGWQLSGAYRWTSGLPFSLIAPGWDTDWQITAFAVNVGNVKAKKYRDSSGNIQYFADPNGINSGAATGSPIRIPYGGETGQRNNFRGDGYLNLDTGLSKSWNLERFGALKFSWEVYNATNTNRYDPFSINSQLTNGQLGVANKLLTLPRRMQFAMRYDF